MKMFTWSEVARQMLGCPSQRSTILIFKYASRKEGEQKNNEKKIPISLTLSVKITLKMQI